MRMKSVLRSRTASRRTLPYSLTAVLPTFDAETTHCRVEIFREKEDHQLRRQRTKELRELSDCLCFIIFVHRFWQLFESHIIFNNLGKLGQQFLILYVWSTILYPLWILDLSSYRRVLFARLFSRVFFHYLIWRKNAAVQIFFHMFFHIHILIVNGL